MSLLTNNMCRTCMQCESNPEEMLSSNELKIKTQMVSIFTVPEYSTEKLCLMELLKAATPQLKIKEDDELPKIVCMECLKKIEEMYRFQQKCLSVEQKFYSMLKESISDTTDPFCDNVKNEAIFKTEFDAELSLLSEDDRLIEAVANEKFSDLSDMSADLGWDERSGSDWEEQIQSKSKKIPIPTTQKSKTIDDGIFKQFRRADNDVFKTTPFNGLVNVKTRRAQEQIYPCDICKKKLKSKLSLKKHQETHKEERSYECNICNRGERPFLCSECGKGFTTAGGLRQHSFRHQDKNQFPCPDCPKSFSNKNDLLSHSHIHKALPRKYICDVCGRGFKKPFLLKQHKMYHNNVRPFSCEYCEKCFFTNEKLKRHTRIHTGEKPYKCKYCEKAYCQSTELIKHMRCHLGEDVYQCEFCPLRFPSSKILHEHFTAHKNDDEDTKARNLAERNAMDMHGVYFK